MAALLGATALPPRPVCSTALVLGGIGGYWQWPPPWLSVDSIPGGLPIQPLPSRVTAEFINPSWDDPSFNRFTLGTEVEIAVSVAAEVGTVEQVRLFLDGKLLDLPVRFPQADPSSPLGGYSRDGIYGYVWTPDRPGTYELSVQAMDNAGGVSEFTEKSTAKVTIGADPLGIPPVVRMTEPVPGGFGDTYPDYSYDSELFINVLAYDPDGDLEYVKIFLNGEELGEAQGRYGDTYIYKWEVATKREDSQLFVLQAVAKDNDGNIVRSATLGGITADNSGNTRPKVEIDNIFVDNEGVKLRALAEARESEFWGGISRVQFFINGVTLDAVGGQGTFFADGLSEYSMSWVPDSPGIYTIYAMAVGSVGHFGDHYTMSDPYVFEVTEEHLALFSSTNAGPYVSLISPGPHVEGQAIAVANLDESLLPNDPDYGRLKSISMISFGEGYHADPLPEIEIFGGGGMGAQASAEISNGAVTNITLSDGGSSYTDDLELEISGVIASGSDLELEPIIENGVITEIPILEGGMGYSHNDLVTIFSLQNGINAGYGARASVEVDENGSVTKLNILNGGQNYDPNYLRVFIISNGSGFEADINNAVILNGVVTKINIIDPGKDYIADKNYTLIPKSGTGGTGTDLKATILASDIIDGAVVARITNFGQGYSYPPSVLITGGKTDSFSSPFVFTQGSLVTLEAEAYDADGNVDEVRFYGNGRLLGSAPPGNIDSLQIIDFGEPRSFGTTPPTVSFIGGGPGIGAEAAAIIDENGTLIGIQITSGGIDYTSPPAVVLSPSNGAAVVATIDNVVRNNARKIPGTNRWVVDWNSELSGTFNISVEAIDNELKSTRISTNRYITIIPQSSSKTPRAVNLGPPDLRTYTSGSKLKLYAQATDLDGSLEWVQFYINGEPYGDPIPGNRDMRSVSFPYSIDWVVPAPGVYSFFTRAMDNSKNGVMSSISTITATTGMGNLPNVDFYEPLRVAQAKAEVDSNGSITGFKQPIDGGFGYVKEPEVLITGGDKNASARAVIDKNKSSASFGHVLNIELIDGGSGYDENTSVSLMKGFPLIKPGGETAIVELVLEPIVKQGGGAENQPVFYVLDGGSGYTEPPEVVIEGLGTGMTAEAVIDVDLGIVTEVIPTNLGSGYYQTGNKVILRGGFPLETRSFKVSADDEDGSIEEVTLFVNGRPLQRDRFAPYDFEWSVGSAGFYDIYFEALDNQGNRNLSPVMRREVFYSEAPQFHLQPASPARVSTMIDANGSWPTGELEIDYAGSGYHVPPTIHFIDPEGAGSGALGYAYLTEDQVTKVVIYDGGSGYSPNSVIRLVGGLDTSVDQIRLEMGKTLPLSIYAYDPDTMINQTGFVLEVNGEEIELFITGSDPYFSFLWTPEVPGDYNIRVRGSSIDRTEGYTQNLDVEVYNDSNNSVRILASPSTDNFKHTLGNVALLPFEIDTRYGTVEEIRVFDNGVEVGSYSAEGTNNLIYEPGSGFFTFGWVPNYVGLHEITVSVKFTSGLYIFSEAYDFEAVDGLGISILDKSPGFEGYKLHMQGTSIIVEVQINQGLAPHFSEAYLYGNDIFIKKVKFIQEGIEQPTALDLDEMQQGQTMLVPYDYDPSVSTFEWDFDWNVSYTIFKDDLASHTIYPTEDGDLIDVVKVDLKVIAVTKANLPAGIKGRVLTSETKPSFVRVLDLNKPASTTAMIYKKITGNSPTDSMVRDFKSSINESTGQREMLEFVVNYSIGADLVPMSDLIGANQVIFGETFLADSFYSEYDEWGNDLIGFIRDSLQSSKYVISYGPIYTDRAQFFGDKEGYFFTTRKDFVSRHFYNKFGTLPSINQYASGAKKMWDARRADLYDNLSPAADFIYNLVVEPTKLIGITGSAKQTYLPHMKSTRQEYVDSAKQFILLKFLDDDQRRLKENFNQALEGVLADPSFKNNFNLLWADSTKSDVSDSWKYEDWFGWFTDEAFPWIYHTELGWLYSQSNSQNNIWFFSEQLGWFWTSEEIFKTHPSLAEDQRFIFRVRAGNHGGWEGSWSLITLPSEANDRDSIYLFDYGYSPL